MTTVQSPPKIAYVYLRVSTADQTTDAQGLGLNDWAQMHGYTIADVITDTASGATPWQDRALGALLRDMPAGATLLSPEVSRLARSTIQVLEIAAAAALRDVTIICTKTNLVINDTMASRITTTILALAAEIDREFIRTRTREGIANARANGKQLGRPPGSTSPSKLDSMADQIAKWQRLGLGPTSIAKLCDCSRSTLHTWLNRPKPTTDNRTLPLPF